MGQRFDAKAKAKYLDLVRTEGDHRARNARRLGYCPSTVAAHLKKDEEFAQELEWARDEYGSKFEDAVYKRAVDGVDEPIYYQGTLVGTVRRYSDSLLALALKRHRPEYRDKQQVDLKVSGGVLVVPAAPVDADEWAEKHGDRPDHS